MAKPICVLGVAAKPVIDAWITISCDYIISNIPNAFLIFLTHVIPTLLSLIASTAAAAVPWLWVAGEVDFDIEKVNPPFIVLMILSSFGSFLGWLAAILALSDSKDKFVELYPMPFAMRTLAGFLAAISVQLVLVGLPYGMVRTITAFFSRKFTAKLNKLVGGAKKGVSKSQSNGS